VFRPQSFSLSLRCDFGRLRAWKTDVVRRREAEWSGYILRGEASYFLAIVATMFVIAPVAKVLGRPLEGLEILFYALPFGMLANLVTLWLYRRLVEKAGNTVQRAIQLTPLAFSFIWAGVIYDLVDREDGGGLLNPTFWPTFSVAVVSSVIYSVRTARANGEDESAVT
jgi:hypothetical protein